MKCYLLLTLLIHKYRGFVNRGLQVRFFLAGFATVFHGERNRE